MQGLMQDRPLDVLKLMRRVGQLFGHKKIITATASERLATCTRKRPVSGLAIDARDAKVARATRSSCGPAPLERITTPESAAIEAREASTATPTRRTGGAIPASTPGAVRGAGTTCGSTLGAVRQLPARPMAMLRAAAVAGPARRLAGDVMSPAAASRCRGR